MTTSTIPAQEQDHDHPEPTHSPPPPSESTIPCQPSPPWASDYSLDHQNLETLSSAAAAVEPAFFNRDRVYQQDTGAENDAENDDDEIVMPTTSHVNTQSEPNTHLTSTASATENQHQHTIPIRTRPTSTTSLPPTRPIILHTRLNPSDPSSVSTSIHPFNAVLNFRDFLAIMAEKIGKERVERKTFRVRDMRGNTVPKDPVLWLEYVRPGMEVFVDVE